MSDIPAKNLFFFFSPRFFSPPPPPYFLFTLLLSSGCLHLIDSGPEPAEGFDTEHSSLFLSVSAASYHSTC